MMMSDYTHNPFNDDEPLFDGPRDVVPRGPADPEAVAALEAMHGQAVTITYQEIDATGVRTVEQEALLISTDAPLD
jgi:hypothetical protein